MGSDCGAHRFLDSFKLHGCIYMNCHVCGSEKCSHWPYCPRCAWDTIQAANANAALWKRDKEASDLQVEELVTALRDIHREATIHDLSPMLAKNVQRISAVAAKYIEKRVCDHASGIAMSGEKRGRCVDCGENRVELPSGCICGPAGRCDYHAMTDVTVPVKRVEASPLKCAWCGHVSDEINDVIRRSSYGQDICDNCISSRELESS